MARFHNEVLRIEIIPRVKSIKSPNESPKVENHNKGTKIPATIEEKNIWENAWPEAAVPLIFGNSSNAAIEITGITAAIPILYNAIKPIFIFCWIVFYISSSIFIAKCYNVFLFFNEILLW